VVPNADLVSLFIYGTGINLNWRKRITHSNHLQRPITLITWIDHSNITGDTEADIINNNFKAKFNSNTNDEKIIWDGNYLLQYAMHAITLIHLILH
jgi:hypothetical protein